MLHQYVYEWTNWVYEKETNKTLLFIDICINLRYVYLKSHFFYYKKRESVMQMKQNWKWATKQLLKSECLYKIKWEI